MKKQSFTKKTLSNIAAPETGRIYVHDGSEKGLSVYVTPNGAVTFFVRKRINGRDERIVIGRFPDISIEQARQKAMEIKSQVALGKDPSEDKKRLRAEITFGEMFQEYMERYSKKQKRSWKFDEREVNKFCSHWFTRKASHISRQEVQILHERVHDNNGLYQANRILERISAIYNRAIRWGWEGTNPARGVKKFKEKSRDRFLKRDEMPRFFAALAEDQNEIAREFILLSLLTAHAKPTCWRCGGTKSILTCRSGAYRKRKMVSHTPCRFPSRQLRYWSADERPPTACSFFQATAKRGIMPTLNVHGSVF
jgi:hypothetical protein